MLGRHFDLAKTALHLERRPTTTGHLNDPIRLVAGIRRPDGVAWGDVCDGFRGAFATIPPRRSRVPGQRDNRPALNRIAACSPRGRTLISPRP